MCHGRKAQRNAILLPLKMKAGAINEGMQTPVELSRQNKTQILPSHLQKGMQLC